MQIRFRDLEIVAEDGIEFYFQRGDGCPLPFPLFDLCQKLFAVTAQVPQLIQFPVNATSDHAALTQGNRRLGYDGRVDFLTEIA